MDIAEPLKPSPKDRIKDLTEEVNSKATDKVDFITRALFAAELIKEALDLDKISLQKCIDFANSLIDFNAVPVIIGTPEKKIFPIEIIINSRPAMIESTRKFVAKSGIDLDQRCQELKDQAQNLSDLLEIGHDWVERAYGPFNLSPEQITEEVMKKVKNHDVAKQLLLNDENGMDKDEDNEKREAVESFIKLNFSNFVVGQNLLNHTKKNYQLK